MANETITMFTSGSASNQVSSYHIEQTGTGSGNSEFNLNTALTPVPTMGTVIAFKAWLQVLGASVTVQPIMGLASGLVASPNTINTVANTAVAAANTNDVAAVPYAALGAFTTPPTATSDFFIATKPDHATTTSTIQVIIVIKHGAQ